MTRTRFLLRNFPYHRYSSSILFSTTLIPPIIVISSMLLQLIFVISSAAGARSSISTYYQDVGGIYSRNHTLYFQDGPYRATRNLLVQPGANLTIEQGVKIYFDPGVGIIVQGVLHAVGSWYVPIEFLPSHEPSEDEREQEFPDFRLVDGPTTRQGRLQAYYNGRWRAVCTRNTNWTEVEYAVACRTMGFSGGGFWRWYLRNNDTSPLAMSKPGCGSNVMTSLRQCSNWTDSMIGLGEFLCQGEDDLGLICWGPPSFRGWQYHWRGVEFVNAPWTEVPADPDNVATQPRSKSRLEWVHIHYAGYNKETDNSTAAIYVQGVPPVINFVNVLHSARDGIRIVEPDGPVEITNCTISWNRGHGVVVDNTSDGRVFINETRIQYNWGDGVQYSARSRIGYSALLDRFGYDAVSYYEPEFPEVNFCKDHELPQSGKRTRFPHVVAAQLPNGTALGNNSSFPCFMKLSLPPSLPYTYTIKFLDVRNYNPPSMGTRTFLHICENVAGAGQLAEGCRAARYKIPLFNDVVIPSVDALNTKSSLWLGLSHEGAPSGNLYGDVRVVMKIHASVKDQVIYGLNISNSRITHNYGKGVFLTNVRDRTVINNVTLTHNQHLAGLHVSGGAGDIWINNSYIDHNLGDGVNISYCGGSTIVNSTSISNNTLRGIAFHYNDSSFSTGGGDRRYYRFLPIKQEIVIKGRPSNNNDHKPTLINYNGWGGILVGNFCAHALNPASGSPKVIVNYVELIGNRYHPAFEYHSCRRADQGDYQTSVEFSGSRCQHSTGFCVRVQPAVNIRLDINDNIFFNNERSVLIVRNKEYPELASLPALVSITRNQMKFNTGPFIVNIGLNDGSPVQTMHFMLQNEIRENTVYNPFPYLTARHQPYAALIVSSSNVVLRRNCFNNPRAEYEIATDLDAHYRVIDAEENNWGQQSGGGASSSSTDPSVFMYKIFDQFKRYTLAAIDLDPYMAICNAQSPRITQLLGFYRQFRKADLPNVVGGIVYENYDFPPGEYTVVDDLHIAPGASLTLAPGVTLKFKDSIGLLVQGELSRGYQQQSSSSSDSILFTRVDWEPPSVPNIRLIPAQGSEGQQKPSSAGRLEVLVDGQWGSVCNRSWNVDLAALACNQLGMVIDPEYLENWLVYFDPADPAAIASAPPIVMDIVRCEEWETDLTRCRHDTPAESRNNSCAQWDLVGLRCVEPHWAGVRYTLLANPPTVTGQTSVRNLIIEKAGLLDYGAPEFAPALRIDWNCHLFQELTVRDNFWTGLDVIYNDVVRKPKITNSRFERNRRHGVRLRSVGLTMEYVVVSGNENAGVLFDPILSAKEHLDVYTWIHRPDALTNNVRVIPDPDPKNSNSASEIQLTPALREQRQFLVTKDVGVCQGVGANGTSTGTACSYVLRVTASGGQTGVESRIGVQVVSPPGNETDENLLFVDRANQRTWDLRRDLIDFPLVTQSSTITIQYSRTYGPASIVILLLYLDYYQLVDTFFHMRYSRIENNQYGLATAHYSNFTHDDGSVIQRRRREQLWFRRTNFTGNREAVIWVNGPLRDFAPDSPLAQIEYYIDNCSITLNNGSIIETHRDLYSSANVFLWKVWRSNFVRNANSGFSVALPDIFDRYAPDDIHRFEVIENEFVENSRFEFVLAGYYAWVNISSNNFTSNSARIDGPTRHGGLLKVTGMEKELIMLRNRFIGNWGRFMILYDIRSQSINQSAAAIPAEIRYNYVTDNVYLMAGVTTGSGSGSGSEIGGSDQQRQVDNWPRSFACGILGLQKVQVNYNNFRNELMDFEMVVGLKGAALTDTSNITYNYWGKLTSAEIDNRIFDFDDWNIYSVATFSPYYVTEERSINFEWSPTDGQTGTYTYEDPPSVDDLHGRVFKSITLQRRREKWPTYPFYYKPDKPYRIRKDLTIMPGATLTIERGVEIRVYPNVRILVLGTLIAEGTFYEPIRFTPINVTEWREIQNNARNFNSTTTTTTSNRTIGSKLLKREAEIFSGKLLRRSKRRVDSIYRQFPMLHRSDGFYQKFQTYLVDPEDSRTGENNNNKNTSTTTYGRNAKGFVEIYNRTTGEMVPLCDRQFTKRNAEVVCREAAGYETRNAYVWIGPRYDRDPKLRIIKAYSEPRQCTGEEARLDMCDLRLQGDVQLWQCVDSEHYVYVHCGQFRSSREDVYVGEWGGIVLSAANLEAAAAGTGTGAGAFQPPSGYSKTSGGTDGKTSILRHVEIVGAGYAHNDSYGAALTTVFQTPILDHVNVTNSSLHGVHVIAPRRNMDLDKLNVTHNHGVGLNVLTLNLQSQNPVQILQDGQGQSRGQGWGQNTGGMEPLRNITIPYNLFGFLDMCSVGKDVKVEQRLLVYYKYDSYPVDCVKFFTSSNRNRPIGFKLLQANIYSTNDPTARPDGFTFYNGRNTSRAAVIQQMLSGGGGQDQDQDLGRTIQSRGVPTLAVHWRANPADGAYGFIAEVVTLPAPPDLASIRQISVKNSRFEHNDRGAFNYYSMGDLSPDLFVDRCYFGRNGYHLWGNFTTSLAAVRFDLRNTQNMKLQRSLFYANQGGLRISAGSGSTSGASASGSGSGANSRLQGVVRDCAFANNRNAETLRLEGRDYQLIYVLNNYLGKNRAPYHDVVFANRILVNFTGNIFFNNTGLHVVDLTGYRQIATEFQTFSANYLYDNLATGHGYQFGQRYGYFPDRDVEYVYREQKRKRRKRRQTSENADVVFLNTPLDRPGSSGGTQDLLVPSPSQFPTDGIGTGIGTATTGTSFEWWANVGLETDRYRSTILAGTGQQHYELNYFNNPLNDFELTTVPSSRYDAYSGPVVARYNYWGYPGTPAVAAGRIRDGHDSGFLINVDYLPALESNTTLMDGFCPPGWFRAGVEDWKSFQSCFLFVAGVTTFKEANQFCKDQGAYMPFFRANDRRLAGVAGRVDGLSAKFNLPYERYVPYDQNRDVWFWISGVSVPPEQCGYLSSRTGEIGYQNCEDLLPFVCERGPGQYGEPVFWTAAGIAALSIGLSLLFLIGLFLLLWYVKSRRRTKEFFQRKASLRNSIRSNNKMAAAAEKEAESAAAASKRKNYNNTVTPTTTKDKEKKKQVGGDSSPDLVAEGHRKLVLAGSKRSLVSPDTSTILVTPNPTSPGTRSTGSTTTTRTSRTTTTGSPYKKSSMPTASRTATTSAYRSDYSATGTPTTTSDGDYTKSTPSLSSFKDSSSRFGTSIASLLENMGARKGKLSSDAASTTTAATTTPSTAPIPAGPPEVRLRPRSMLSRGDRGEGGDRRRSDAMTMTSIGTGTGTTLTCSTCPTTDRSTIVSYDPSGVGTDPDHDDPDHREDQYRSSVDTTRTSAISCSSSARSPAESTVTEESEVTTSEDEDVGVQDRRDRGLEGGSDRCSTSAAAVLDPADAQTPGYHRGHKYLPAGGSDSVIDQQDFHSPNHHHDHRVHHDSPSPRSKMAGASMEQDLDPRRRVKVGILTASQDSLLTASTTSSATSRGGLLPPYPPACHQSFGITGGGGNNHNHYRSPPDTNFYDRRRYPINLNGVRDLDDEDEDQQKPMPLETAM